MKTSKSINPGNVSNIQKIQGIVISIACIFALFMTSCKKDNLVTPSAQNISQADRKGDILPRGFTMIKIDHDAGLTNALDYSVSVSSDGLVTYEGRANVVKGKIQFNVSDEIVAMIKSLFEPASILASKQSDIAARLGPPIIPEHQIITTTYSNGRGIPKVYIDLNTGYPKDVVYRRTRVENLLGIAKLIKGGADYDGTAKVQDAVN